MKAVVALLVRTVICALAAVGLYLGSVLVYAVVEEDLANAAQRRELAPDRADIINTEKAHWQAAAGAWRLVGFAGRAAEAEARSALAGAADEGAQRQIQTARIKAALALRPTRSDLWFELAQLQLLDEATLSPVLSSLAMAQLTAPREVEPALARTLLMLQSWARIQSLAASAEEVETLRNAVVQDIASARLGYTPFEFNMVRTAFAALPPEDRAGFRDALVGRMGEAVANSFIPQPSS
ncbi:hypothetical protein ABLE91_06645 [Aquabacter sp. CN5-332]|uniref:hypothetical protein n=1 Tax=Aquabacter sp. CN5-332 TaxID=3156608 RepID=UPI0032B3CFD1